MSGAGWGGVTWPRPPGHPGHAPQHAPDLVSTNSTPYQLATPFAGVDDNDYLKLRVGNLASAVTLVMSCLADVAVRSGTPLITIRSSETAWPIERRAAVNKATEAGGVEEEERHCVRQGSEAAWHR
ncbi:hypothetical protein Pmani_039645 [Petrolisthes manimaculis]|uniref:Uncharacterized protein n=1 Tax=Petrolisthes manimaculis TaxID=1843537 RepID=A0AAE1NC48_9EUCA|nr:hypothetical protein Pmani_039645 [Petrolisthes manimaculis]